MDYTALNSHGSNSLHGKGLGLPSPVSLAKVVLLDDYEKHFLIVSILTKHLAPEVNQLHEFPNTFV